MTKVKLINLFRRIPKRFFLIFSLINGFSTFLYYFGKNQFSPPIDFNLFCIIFLTGSISSLVVLGASSISNFLLSKTKAPEYLKFNFSALFATVVFFGSWVLSERVVSIIGLGNYTGTLTINSEVLEKLIEFPELSPKIGNKINPVNIVWTYGKQWFVKIPVENIVPCVVDVDPRLVSNTSKEWQ